MPGARGTRGLVCKKVYECAHEHTGSAETLRHPPRNGFTAYSALSPATNSFCHRRQRIKICPARLRRHNLRWLDISNGCQDHTSSPYAARLRLLPRRSVHPTAAFAKPALAPFVCAPAVRSRSKPPCDRLARRRCRVHRILPHVRDDGRRPSCRDRMAQVVALICPTATVEYFLKRGLTGFS
jgi:hypothetical protein